MLMKFSFRKIVTGGRLLPLFFLPALPVVVAGQVTLPAILSHGMVLQREVPVPLRGMASPYERVKLEFRGRSYRTTAGPDGNWSISLPPQPAGGPWEMEFRGKNVVRVSDILFGDVWICSGQSNMVLPMERVKEKYPEEIAGARFPQVRHFFIPPAANLLQPVRHPGQGSWMAADPESVLSFSAVAWFFGKSVHEKYGVPVGLVNASVGGTPVEAWISGEGLAGFPVSLERMRQNREMAAEPDSGKEISPVPDARQDQRSGKPRDEGYAATPAWYDPACETDGWKPYTIPGFWADQGFRNLRGVVWFRRWITVPEPMAGKPARLFMGRIVDADEVYLNGQKIGNTTYQYPPRRYRVPAGLLKPGKNLVAVRVTNTAGKGGFVPDKPYFLEAGGEQIDLRGEWLCRVGEIYPPIPSAPYFNPQYQPAALYNGMIAPIAGFAAKGFLWYQGEADTGNPPLYRKLLPALIRDWRLRWGMGELPFLFVQLANFMEVDYLPAESQWAELRDAQFSSLAVPRTAMAVAIDLGEWNDIHPLNKKEVGRRLALAAFRLAYQDTGLVSSGPLYRSFAVRNDSILLSFDHAGSGLATCDGKPLQRFEIAGADGKFVGATARIAGDRVVVWHERIQRPERARYAWADNPEGANLCNREGLPASPFRTWNPDSADSKTWRGKQCAVVLTYDDGLNVHLDNVIPLLDSLGLKATFYIPANSEPFRTRVPEWKSAARHGHELGNHTLFHPCNGKLPGRDWVSPDYDLSEYSPNRFMDEVKTCNLLLSCLDGKSSRSFAYTCGDREAGGLSFMPQIMREFTVARGVHSIMQPIREVDLSCTGSFMISGQKGDSMINLVTRAMESQSLLVFLFHGVGGEHALDVSLPDHRALIRFLKQNEDRIWVATLQEVGDHIVAYRKSH